MAHDVNGKWIGLGLGDTGPAVTKLQHRLLKAFPTNSKAVSLGVTESGTFDPATAQAVSNIQPFLHPPQAPTGVANYAAQVELGVVAAPPKPNAYANTWFFSAPGSGAAWWLGPSFDVGEWCKRVLGLNHQPVGFPIGGYMGLMGGDPGLSYNDVIHAEDLSLQDLLDSNPAVQRALSDVSAGKSTDLELWFSAYSQSADGMVCSVNRLFGDGGKYEKLRSRINGLLMFGNPARQPGQTLVGNSPVGWGISRKTFPQWLNALTWSITAEGPGAPDFYAACDDEIRPLFYEVIVQAEASLSFFEHVAMIVIPILLNTFSGLLGGLGGGLGSASGLIAPILSIATGLPTGLLGQAVGAASTPNPLGPSDAEVNAKLTQLFTISGIITNIPALIHLLGSLPGIQSHGSYYDPHPEFGGRNGLQVACDAVITHRR